MAAAALLKKTPKPTDADIDAAMTNICRCGTYQRVRAAIHLAPRGNAPKREGGTRHDRTPTRSSARLARGARRRRCLGTGLALGFHLPAFAKGAEGFRPMAKGAELNAWVVVGTRRHGDDPHRPLRDGAGHV
jgi:xanthine dehydrogenase iron-sulfur cluster and FAD-binding subunit A